MTIQENLSSDLSLSISQSCQALEVSRSGYYKWRTQPEIASTDSKDMDLKNQFQEIALEFPMVTGGLRLNSRTEVMQLTANAC